MKSVRTNNDGTQPVFKLSELAEEYEDHLTELDTEINYIHNTRFQRSTKHHTSTTHHIKILDCIPTFLLEPIFEIRFSDALPCNKAPELEATSSESGSTSLMTFKEDVDSVIKSECRQNYDEEGFILSQAADIIKKDFFTLVRVIGAICRPTVRLQVWLHP